MKDAEMHVVSLFGAGILAAALTVPLVVLNGSNKVDGPLLKEQEVIEATIAYRKTPQKQPQKKTAPPPVEEPEGVSRDENKKPVEEKKDKKEPEKADPDNPFGKFGREETAGPQTNPTVGDFNGSEKGFAEESKGDPFFGRLSGDMKFEDFTKDGEVTSNPIGCIHLQADGRIKAITFDPPIGTKSDDSISQSAEDALKRLQAARAKDPEPVPTHLLGITSKWLCFRFKKSSQ